MARNTALKESKDRKSVKNILITGTPGVGKTTLIRDLIAELNISAGGFYTAEVRDGNGKRWGFKIISLDGQEEILASVEIISQRKVGKYGVDVGAVDRIGVKSVRDALNSKELVVIDEIGRMELISKQFRNIAMKALNSPKPVLGTVAIKETNFTERLKKRQDTRIIKLKRENLSEVVKHVEKLLKQQGLAINQ